MNLSPTNPAVNRGYADRGSRFAAAHEARDDETDQVDAESQGADGPQRRVWL
jgi:hypothetical protein